MTKEEIAKVTKIRKRFYMLSDAEVLAEYEAAGRIAQKTYTVRIWVYRVGWCDAGVALSYLAACELEDKLTAEGKTVMVVCDAHGTLININGGDCRECKGK